MSFLFRIFILPALIGLLLGVVSADQAKAETQQYDLAYAWDKDLASILDYKEQLEELFEPDIGKRLKVVKKDNEYGVIYDCSVSAMEIVKVIFKQGVILEEAGLDQAFGIKDKGYHELFNVSYGYGPNLDAMKKEYQKVYTHLGRSVGKDLYIEKDDKDNYKMVYRRHGDRSSTMRVAKRHGNLLRKKGIRTTIAQELNNAIVYGESTYLHGEEETEAKQATASPSQVKSLIRPDTHQESVSKTLKSSGHQSASPIILQSGKYKVAVHENIAKAVSRTAGTPSSEIYKPRIEQRTSTASHIEVQIEKYIKQLRKKGQLRGDEQTSWMVYDLNLDKSLVNINADKSFQAASMIKPFVALAFFHRVKEGRLKYGPKSRSKLEAMLQRSSNPATNWVMRKVGGPAGCQKILTQHYANLFKQLHIVEYIPKGGRTYRNRALPSDYVRFLRALWNKKLPYSNEIRRIMSLPGRDRLYYGTPIPQGTLVYNKTGTTAHLCGDMGILVPKTKNRDRYPYAIVGIIERSSRPSNYRKWMKSRGGVIRKVSTLVYDVLKKKHGFM